jgi:hypothetical protein
MLVRVNRMWEGKCKREGKRISGKRKKLRRGKIRKENNVTIVT